MNKTALHLFLLVSILVTQSCASVKTTSKVNSPAGDWVYVITGTPDGNFEGIMNIIKSGDSFSGQLNSKVGTLPFESFVYSEAENKITATFDYSGNPVTLTGIIADKQMTGKVSTSGYEFPLKATRN